MRKLAPRATKSLRKMVKIWRSLDLSWIRVTRKVSINHIRTIWLIHRHKNLHSGMSESLERYTMRLNDHPPKDRHLDCSRVWSWMNRYTKMQEITDFILRFHSKITKINKDHSFQRKRHYPTTSLSPFSAAYEKLAQFIQQNGLFLWIIEWNTQSVHKP